MNRNRKYESMKELFGAMWYPIQNNLVDHHIPGQSIMCVGCHLVASSFGLRAAIWVKSPTSRIIINLGPKTRPQRVIGRRSPIPLKGLLLVRGAQRRTKFLSTFSTLAGRGWGAVGWTSAARHRAVDEASMAGRGSRQSERTRRM